MEYVKLFDQPRKWHVLVWDREAGMEGCLPDGQAAAGQNVCPRPSLPLEDCEGELAMELHVYRKLANGQLVYLGDKATGIVGSEFLPVGEVGISRLEWAIASCKYMADFYKRHTVSVSHVIGVQRGWTVEYLEVE